MSAVTTPPKITSVPVLIEHNPHPPRALHPDITSEPVRELVTTWTSTVANTDSSPISTIAEEGHTSFCSTSTAQTTPLRHQLFQARNLAAENTIENYLYLVSRADLPGQCLQYFTNLAQSVDTISSGFIPSTNGRYRINNNFFRDLCETLLTGIEAPLNKTTAQITQIAHLRSLAVFQATVSDQFLWTAYRKRAELVIRSLALPSLTERRLVHRLALLYNTCVYETAQQLYDEDEIEREAMSALNSLYDAVFTWLTRYKQWCNAMKDLKEQHIQPLIERILASDDVVAEIKQFRHVKEKAQKAINDPRAPDALPVDDRVLKVLHLSSRRKQAQATVPRRRFQRQLTI